MLCARDHDRAQGMRGCKCSAYQFSEVRDRHVRARVGTDQGLRTMPMLPVWSADCAADSWLLPDTMFWNQSALTVRSVACSTKLKPMGLYTWFSTAIWVVIWASRMLPSTTGSGPCRMHGSKRESVHGCACAGAQRKTADALAVCWIGVQPLMMQWQCLALALRHMLRG